MTTTTETNTDDRMLRMRDVCATLKVSRRTLRTYVTQGRLRAYRLPGGHFRFREEDLDSLLTECAGAVSPEHARRCDARGQ